MKALKYWILPLALLVCTGTDAWGRKKSKKKQKATVEVVDTCSVADFSYAAGMANTQGLVDYLTGRLGVDPAYMPEFLRGLGVAEQSAMDKMLQAYCAGLQIRQQMELQIIPGIDQQIVGNDSVKTVNKAAFVEGFIDGIAQNANARLTMDSAQVLAEKQMQYYNRVKMERQYGPNKAQGEAFLAENAKKDSVQTTASGLQYKVITKGTGAVPTATSRVKVNYEGRLIDGTVFDSSYKRKQPATFGCNQVIKGWTEALTMMPVGSKWEIYIPQELGYGDREAGKIKPFSALIFTVELLGIE